MTGRVSESLLGFLIQLVEEWKRDDRPDEILRQPLLVVIVDGRLRMRDSIRRDSGFGGLGWSRLRTGWGGGIRRLPFRRPARGFFSCRWCARFLFGHGLPHKQNHVAARGAETPCASPHRVRQQR